MSRFAVGQRWISESEPELGLGLVMSVEHRRVQILFSAGGETRLYAADQAPVKRVRFQPGDEVEGPDRIRFTIESVDEADGVLTYRGGGQVLAEAGLADSMSFDKPEGRLFAGHVDDRGDFEIRLETLRHRHRVRRSAVRGFLGGRVQLLPHQFYIAQEVARRHVPRVLLADEVGLGKTIEACLILHRMLVSGKVRRVLILMPEPLIHQWFVELLRRFNLCFSIFDEERCLAIESGDPGTNPFLDEQLVLCGVESLARSAVRMGQAEKAGWDLLIVDEAHHLQWSPDNPSREYALVEHLAERTPALLLLTATPEQLGLKSHFARLRLLDPHRYPDYERFVAEHDDYERVAHEAQAVIASGDEAALRELLDRHGPGRVIFRNTRSAMSGFPRRIPHLVPLPASGTADPRVGWLAGFLRDQPDLKVLLICQTHEEVLALHDELRKRINVKTALFHEEMPILQCDRQAAWFAEEDGARLLIASEIGGEGRNFQFAHHLVLVSLPDDPEMLEQRIGRLDRIGQTQDIHIHVPYVEGTREAGRVRWYHEGLNAFAQPLSGGYELMNVFKDRLDQVDDALVAETRTFRRDLEARIERGRDRLLELSSFRPQVADEVVRAVRGVDADPGLAEYLLRLFDYFGVHVEDLDGRDHILVPGHTFHDAFPLRDERLLITYDRARALAREDMTLMSWDHPMVEDGMALILGSERGNSACAQAEGFEGFMLQAVFVLECVAPPELEADRFLPATPIVVCVDQALTEVEPPAKLSDANIWDLLEREPSPRSLGPALLTEARKRAEQQVPRLIDEARGAMRDVVGAEYERLRSLLGINDHIRPEEVEQAKNQATELNEALGRARLRLDAVMLIGNLNSPL